MVSSVDPSLAVAPAKIPEERPQTPRVTNDAGFPGFHSMIYQVFMCMLIHFQRYPLRVIVTASCSVRVLHDASELGVYDEACLA